MFVCNQEIVDQLVDKGVITTGKFSDLLNQAPPLLHTNRGSPIRGRLCILKNKENRGGKTIILYSVFYQDTNSLIDGDRVISPFFNNEENPAKALGKVLIKVLDSGEFVIRKGSIIEAV